MKNHKGAIRFFEKILDKNIKETIRNFFNFSNFGGRRAHLHTLLGLRSMFEIKMASKDFDTKMGTKTDF